MKDIYCPFCKKKMIRVKGEKGQIAWHWWDCTNCEQILEIRQKPWYPIKEIEQ